MTAENIVDTKESMPNQQNKGGIIKTLIPVALFDNQLADEMVIAVFSLEIEDCTEWLEAIVN